MACESSAGAGSVVVTPRWGRGSPSSPSSLGRRVGQVPLLEWRVPGLSKRGGSWAGSHGIFHHWVNNMDFFGGIHAGVIGFSGMGGGPEAKGGSRRWQEPGAALGVRGRAPVLGARSCSARVCCGQQGNGAGGIAGDRILPTQPGLSLQPWQWSHPHPEAQRCLPGWDCLPPSRRHPRNQRKPRPALSWCPANEPEPWLSPALAAPGAVGCFSSFPCASGPERKSPGRAGGGYKVAAAAVPRWHRHRDVTRGCAGLCRMTLISSQSLWKGLGLFSPCSPQRCIPVELFPSRLMLQGETGVFDLRLLGPSQPPFQARLACVS